MSEKIEVIESTATNGYVQIVGKDESGNVRKFQAKQTDLSESCPGPAECKAAFKSDRAAFTEVLNED